MMIWLSLTLRTPRAAECKNAFCPFMHDKRFSSHTYTRPTSFPLSWLSRQMRAIERAQPAAGGIAGNSTSREETKKKTNPPIWRVKQDPPGDSAPPLLSRQSANLLSTPTVRHSQARDDGSESKGQTGERRGIGWQYAQAVC